jgi:hypothetical protein
VATSHDFTGCSDGGNPTGVVTIGAGGTLYGTASNGGSLSCKGGAGVVWMIKP